MQKEYKTISSISGSLIIVNEVEGVKSEELVEVRLPQEKKLRLGKVLEVSDKKALVQMFENTQGMGIEGTKAKFLGESLKLDVSNDMLGRIFNGIGAPLDNGANIIPEKRLEISGTPINPYSRDYPNEFIQTGISALDCLNTLVRGQKLPIFSEAGLPHNQLVAMIAKNAKLKDSEKFVIVFAGIGLTFEESAYFQEEFEKTGALDNAVLFINTAADPLLERIATPRLALTTAEYLAYEKDLHVLVILSDLTNYTEAVCEISAARKEIPGKRGTPHSLHTDLASLYERSGRIKGKKGSITQIPILTMPAGDITHPICEITGSLTEGQIVLSRELHREGIFPPINVLQSLSRLAPLTQKNTREGHEDLCNQLYAAYVRGTELRELILFLGKNAIHEQDYTFVQFATDFEKHYLNQKSDENRSLEKSLDLGWQLLKNLPRAELKKVRAELIEKYLKKS